MGERDCERRACICVVVWREIALSGGVVVQEWRFVVIVCEWCILGKGMRETWVGGLTAMEKCRCRENRGFLGDVLWFSEAQTRMNHGEGNSGRKERLCVGTITG